MLHPPSPSLTGLVQSKHLDLTSILQQIDDIFSELAIDGMRKVVWLGSLK
jgi:hypothetical protein